MIPIPYNTITQPLDTAATNKKFQIPGDSLEFAVSTSGTLANVSVRLDSKKADPIPLDMFKAQKFPSGFSEFYVTWTAQSNKTLYIFVGRAGSQVRRV